MGWDTSSDWRGPKDVQAAILSDFKRAGDTVLDKASTSSGRHFWVAVATPQGEKYIALALIEKQGRRGDQEWGFKLMSEESGPVEVDVPPRMLDLFPPPTQGAARWREKARHVATMGIAPGTPVWFNQQEYTILGLDPHKGYYRVIAKKDGRTYRLKAAYLQTQPEGAIGL